ncbi:hypothetical protein PG988_002078 [Apiospora saccharicola]
MPQGLDNEEDSILDASKYIYEPITGEGTTRMLILHNGACEDELAGDLEMAKLADYPPWKALSYAWGTTTVYSRIRIGTRFIRISTNLEGALQILRQKHGDEYPDRELRLWIDQICIDQENVQERSQQVQLMFSVYEKAERVLVWLGPDRHNLVERAFYAIHRVASLTKEQRKRLRNEDLGALLSPLELEAVKALLD